MKSLKKWVVTGLVALTVGMGIEVQQAKAGLTPQQIVQITQAGIKGAKVLGKVVRARRGRR